MSVLNKLGPEILLMVVEEIYLIEPRIIPNLRYVTRKLSSIAAPLLYRQLDLRSHHLQSSIADTETQSMLRNVHRYTRHIILKDELDWEAVGKLLRDCMRLESIFWAYAKDRYWGDFPAALRSSIETIRPSIRLTVERLNCPFSGRRFPFTGRGIRRLLEPHVPHTETFPPLNIVEITIHDSGHPVSSIISLQDLLVSARNLEVLHIMNMYADFSLDRGRMPPLRKITSRASSIGETPDIIASVWDFTLLQELRIDWHHFGGLSTLVESAQFMKLIKLTLDYKWSSLEENDSSYHVSRTLLLKAILENAPINQIEVLDVKCRIRFLPISTILSHSQSLKVAKILDVQGYAIEGRTPPTISINEIATLQINCVNLQSLAVPVDLKLCEVQLHQLLRIFCQFPALQSLALYSQEVSNFYSGQEFDGDLIWNSAHAIKHFISGHKQGVSLTQLDINVGGWNSGYVSSGSPTPELGCSICEVTPSPRLIRFLWDSKHVCSFESFTYAQIHLA